MTMIDTGNPDAAFGHDAGAAEAILNALPLAVMVIAADGMIMDANAAAEDFFDMSVAFLRRHTLHDLAPFGSPLLSLIEQVRQRGGAVNEYKVDLGTPRTPSERLVDLHVAPVPERPGAVVVMLQQRTMADKMNRQLTHRGAARSVTALAAMLAHEIKNPLSGIRGAAQLLEQQASDDDRLLTRLICEEADRIVKLVDRMEVFGDQRPVEREKVNIHMVLDHVKRLAQSGFARHIRIVEDYDPSLPPVFASRDQLVQVFLNLVKNAAEAIGETATRRAPVAAGNTPLEGGAAAGILRQGQRPRRARRPDAESFRSVCHNQAKWYRPGSCTSRQDHRRSRRHHRMRVATATNDFSGADAHVHGRRRAGGNLRGCQCPLGTY
jgi:nitrogen-specific signal transduction histidine kinase